MDTPPKVSPELRKEIVRAGEAYLDGQLKVSMSTDQRASSLAGMFTGAATALLAASITLSNTAWATPPVRIPLISGGVAAGVMFLVAAVLCIRAIMPADFWLTGTEPENWETDVAAGRSLDECLADRSAHIQTQINDNLEVIQRNARLFRWGARLGIAAPVFGVAVWALVWASRLLWLAAA